MIIVDVSTDELMASQIKMVERTWIIQIHNRVERNSLKRNNCIYDR